MRPLLNNRSRSIHAKKSKLGINKAWDQGTFLINLLRHFYAIFLMYYYWNYGPDSPDSIGNLLLILYLIVGFVVFVCGYSCVISETLIEEYQINKDTTKSCFLCVSIFAAMLQPLLIILIYVAHLKKNIRGFFYATIFLNLLFNGLPIYLALCYYLVSHPADLFNPTKWHQLLILIYFILYFLSIVSVYPLFMPLLSISKKHLLFKLCAFALNITRILFTTFLLISYYFSNIAVHPIVKYIYDYYLIHFFEVTPILCVWIVCYLVKWHKLYFGMIDDILRNFYLASKCQRIICALCYATYIIFAIIFSPFTFMAMAALYGVFWWIMFEFFIFNIIDAFIFVDSPDMVFQEMDKQPKLQKKNAWKAMYNYLNNINDSIDYQQRLYILQCLSGSDGQFDENIRCIVVKEKIEQHVLTQKYGFLQFFAIRFLKYLTLFGFEGSIEDFKLLHFYDFVTEQFKFKCKDIIYIIWELCGLLVILPIFILSTCIVAVILPFLLFVMYFYVFTEEHSFYVVDYLSDFKLWILLIYLMLLTILSYLFVDEYKLIRIWYDCQCLHVTNLERMNKENIEIYHNHIHEYMMIFDMLNTFFGSLSVTIMEYVGIIKNNGSLSIPSFEEFKQLNEKIVHKHTIVCREYLFEMENY